MGGYYEKSMRTHRVLREAHVTAKPLTDSELNAIMHAMLTVSDAGMLITDLDHRSLACNSRFGDLFCVDSVQVPLMEVEELRERVYPRLADREGWLSNLDEVYADPHSTFNDELVLIDPFKVLRRRTAPVRDASGELRGRIWTFEDVTDQAARQRRRDLIVEASIFHHADPSQVCRYIVERVADEYASTTLLSIRDGDRMVFREVGRPPAGAEHITGNLLQESYCRLALETARPVIVQDAKDRQDLCDVLPAKLGLRRCLTVPITTMEGMPIGTLCFMDDRVDEAITQDDVEFVSVMANRISAELDRERHYEARTLGQRLEAEQQRAELQSVRSNLALTSEELEKAERNLIEAAKLAVSGTLAASIAHDIKNIMASLSLVCSQPGVEDREKLRQVQTQIDRFAVLSHRLLSYVKPRAQARESVNLASAIGQAIELLRPQATISNVKIISKFAHRNSITADASRLEHLLVNLIMNALQAMDSDGGTVVISTKEDPDMVYIVVEDNGRGMSEEVMSRAFEPFFSTRAEGFGLGLYSCFRITSEHGWDIKVESQLAKGTLIQIAIPTWG
jgi:signal transduction histidine kinase